MKKIINCINSKIVDIYTKSGKLTQLKEKVIKHLPQELAPHCIVSNFAKGVLTLQVENAAWASQLRFMTMDLIETLRNEEKLYEVASIKVSIKATHARVKDESMKKINATEKSSELLTQAAHDTPDEHLKGALLKLAGSIKNRIES